MDPRWDQACLNILEELTNLSTPSVQTVIRRATQAFTAAVPGGIPPKRTVAYDRVRELDHGWYTFGEAKQRRSVAKRPHGVQGSCGRPGPWSICCSMGTTSTCSRWSRSRCGGSTPSWPATTRTGSCSHLPLRPNAPALRQSRTSEAVLNADGRATVAALIAASAEAEERARRCIVMQFRPQPSPAAAAINASVFLVLFGEAIDVR